MNHRKTLEYTRTKARIEHHIAALGVKLELATPRVDLEPHVECLGMLLEKARWLSGGNLETKGWETAIAELASRVDARPHLQLVR